MSGIVCMAEAGCGDCIWVRCGDSEKKLNIMIDSGARKSDMQKVLDRISDCSETLDYLVLTHDDEDHVKGLCALIDYIRNKKSSDCTNQKIMETLHNISEGKILFNFGGNGSEELLSARSIDEAAKKLLDDFDFHEIGYVYSDEIEDNTKFPNMIQIQWEIVDDMIQSAIYKGVTEDLLNTEKEHLKILILSPTKEKLKRYIDDAWDDLIPKDKLLTSKNKDEEENEWNYSIQYWMEHDMELGRDNRKANNASISFLLFYKGHCMLFAGDASPNDMVSAGRAFLKRKGDDRDYIDVDFIKLPHHGSSHNVTKEFLSFFRTNSYLISTSGNIKYHHPGKRTLATIASLLSEGETANIYGNYEWWKECSAFIRKEDNWENEGNQCNLIDRDGKIKHLQFHYLNGMGINLNDEIVVLR